MMIRRQSAKADTRDSVSNSVEIQMSHIQFHHKDTKDTKKRLFRNQFSVLSVSKGCVHARLGA